jgi:lipopolysaccharide biosynthesis glycosyltransferase
MIPIFFSIDDHYAPFLSVALGSMIRNASRAYTYKAIILYQELSAEIRRKLAALGTENFGVHFVPMENRLDGITDRTTNRLRADYFTLTIYFRLFIPAMFPEYDKAIYLDSDIVVPGDISELFMTELGDNLIGAAPDHSVVNIPQLVKYIEDGVGIDKYHYINSGVLLMNLKKLREAQLEQRFLELSKKYHFDCCAPDQDYLNALCKGKIVYLPTVWDTMPAEGQEPVGEPRLVHYNLFAKPWCYDGVQYEEYFWQYAKDSVYYPEILGIKAGFHEADRKSDSEHLQLLLSRGEMIAGSPVNFRTVFNDGKECRL